MLVVEGLDVAYGRIQALHGLSIRVEEGEIVTLIGSNGAGKTTTLRALSGLHRPSRGSVRFEGKAIENASAEQIVRLGMAHAPEGRRIFTRLTVLENLEMGAYLVRDQLARSSGIHVNKYGFTQFFSIGDQYWNQYLTGEEPDARKALQNARDAVIAEAAKSS